MEVQLRQIKVDYLVLRVIDNLGIQFQLKSYSGVQLSPPFFSLRLRVSPLKKVFGISF